MRSRLFVALSVGALTFSQAGNAQAQLLNRLNKALEQANSALAEANLTLAGGAKPASTPGATKGVLPGLARISPEQRAAITDRLGKPQQNEDLEQSIAEARATLQPFLERTSCIPGYNGSSLNIFAAPGYSFQMYVSPSIRTQYHDKSVCMDLVRLQGWNKPARNALQVEAVFEAADSGESTKAHYLLVRQPDGVWLLREAY